MNRFASSRILTPLRRLRSAANTAREVFFPETVVTTLPSGFRIATEDTKSSTATIGVWIDAGSRYENEKNNGTAHFLEHMAFKGTSRRSRNELELEVENIGAHLNAYTSREQTVYYAKCFSTDLEHSVDILADILLNSKLNPRDIEAERSVILREMQEVEQNFQEVVFDHLHTGAFEGNSLAMTILGPVENINSIKRDDLINYIQTHYRSGRMVLSAAGGVNHSEVVRLAEKYFGGLKHGDASANFHPAVFKPCEIHIPVIGMDFIYGAMVVEGVSWTHEDNLALMVANTLIGEWDRSRGFGVNAPSRLAVRLGRNAGVQSFQAFNTCYKDTGLIGVYFVAEEAASEALVDSVVDEWRWLANEVDTESVDCGKRTLLTNLLLMLDGSTPICEDIGRQLLCYGRRIPVPELELRIKAIDVETVRNACRKVFIDGQLATTVIGRTGRFPKNVVIEKKLHR
ncbi:Mitochondrial-processing peptidase subunit beta [Parelaphostrongylus tenuis]|uniref:Mitochondrial-processing peptidase subunit beta n=1 Tax=Parelaphostrongylus tenuis TaxID=148309 RepID=A0AAD5RDY8_PARTN|nr:Mitochondrial-processing peptidase subunit beta [Parelaphostrongylus tenuis]